jgi:single-stranded-DNA-specific exonuclease
LKRILPEFEYDDEQLNIINSLAQNTGLCRDTVKILYSRSIDTEEKIKAFLNPSKAHFISPFKMKGMREAVELIKRARDEEWSVVVYGDYDADGVCASTIMRGALRDFGIEPVVYVPERKGGYGLNTAAIDDIFEDCFPQLFITVDCGISNAEEVEYIKEQGAEVIVTDHHELPSQIPDCICINPKFDDDYIYDNLCGAGVAFKVGCALNGESAYKYLDFAAIATVADSVPLTGENRDIVAEGLKLINKSPRKCYSGFLNKGGEQVTAQTLAFSIAPKINAAGRMGDANSALTLFCEEDEGEIFNLAVKLTVYNQERQKCCDELYLSAKQKLKERGAYGRVIMLWDESWNTGFVGIVAARLAEEYARPTLLFVKNGDMLKGSARSVEAVNIFEALKSCDDLIAEFGGHSQAAGVNITQENFSLLEERLNDFLHKNYPSSAFTPTLYVSGILGDNLSLKFVKELELLEPYGVGNKRPLFEVDGEVCTARPVKPQSPHLTVNCGVLDLMYFSGVRSQKIITSAIPKRIVFEYNISTFRGKEYVKGFIRDVIYGGDAGAYAKNEIEFNNLDVAGFSDVECEIEYISREDAQKIIDEDEEYGTLFIVSDYSTLSKYKNLNNLNTNIFLLSSKDLSDAILISPLIDCDLSGYNRIVYLDYPAGVKIPSLAGKHIYICEELQGFGYLKNLNTAREDMLAIFKRISANCNNLEGATSTELAEKNDLGVSALQALFAIKVFEELGLLSFEGGKLTVYKGVKTQLTNSKLYCLAENLKQV